MIVLSLKDIELGLKSTMESFPSIMNPPYPLEQGRSHTSELDEASFERRRREPLERSGGMKPRGSKTLL